MAKRMSVNDCMLCESNPCTCMAKPVSSKKTASKKKPDPVAKTEPHRSIKPVQVKPDMRAAMKATAEESSIRPSIIPKRSAPPIEATNSVGSKINLEPAPYPRIVRRMSLEEVQLQVAILNVQRILGGKPLGDNKFISPGSLGLGEKITYLQGRIASCD